MDGDGFIGEADEVEAGGRIVGQIGDAVLENRIEAGRLSGAIGSGAEDGNTVGSEGLG